MKIAYLSKEDWIDVCIIICYVIIARKRSLGQGNIFRSVCQEFCPQGGLSAPGGMPAPGGVCSQGGVCSWGVPGPRGSGPGGAWWRSPWMATVVGGSHPTGMHSCLTIHVVCNKTYHCRSLTGWGMHQSWMGEGSFDHGLGGDASIMDWEGSFDHGLGGGCINHGWGRGHLIMDWVGMHQSWIGRGHLIMDWVGDASIMNGGGVI